MKRMNWGIIPLLICLFFTACKDDEIASRVEEGLPVSLNMNLVVPGPSDVQTHTRATDEVETNVEKLALFFYKFENSAPNILEIPADGLKKNNQPGVGSATNYFYQIKVTAEQMNQAGIRSGEYWVYAIANWNKGFCALDTVEIKGLTKRQLEEYCVLKTNNLIDLNETALLLTGKYEGPKGEDKIVLTPGVNVLKDFHLKRITAKIIFNFNNGKGVEFVPTEYEIYNYSRSSTLIEREGWTTKNGTVDNKNGTHRGQLLYKGSDDPLAFNSSNGRVIPLSPKPTGRDYNFYFYMLENVQPAKNAITSYAERERRVSPQDKTFKNAPDQGTYVIVRGSYKGKRGGNGQDANDQVQGFVTYTIHLGDCSAATGSMDNFTVRRNAKYKYNITVNGVNNIIVEATTDTENQPGAEGDILKSTENVYYLDAHFETVMIKLKSDQISSYSMLAQTPYGTFSQQVDNPEEGKDDPDIEAKYLGWVKFAAPKLTGGSWGQAAKVEFKAYPGDQNVINIYGLMKEINDFKAKRQAPAGGWHFIEHQGSIYVTAYVDEYYYDDEPDLRKFINAPDRRLALSDITRVSADGESTYTERPIFAINQKSIQSVFDMDGSVLRPFGAETYEETEDAVLSSRGPGQEPSTKNQPRPNWGWRNLWEQLDGYTASHPNFRWDKYVDPAKNGHFSSNASASDALQINPMKNGYNYALYQCFTRNRDENGDGLIDVSEMKWYLPAIDECMAFWNGAAVLSDDVKFNNTSVYFTSTNGSFRTWWALEGSATGIYKPADAPNGKQRVRCIRTIGKFGKDWGVNDNETSAPFAHYDKASRTISIHHMSENTVRTSGSQRGEYNPHDLLGTENKLPEAFQFAEKDLSYRSGFLGSKNTFTYSEVRSGDVCQRYYSEQANKADLGQWRIPNQRELTLIHRYYRNGTVTQTSNLTDYTAARTTYHRNEGEALYFVQTGNPDFITTTWYPNNNSSQNNFTKFKIRCVRDIQPLE